MKYWLDTEFVEDGVTISLISLGIVAEDGREMYWQAVEAPLHRASAWVRENVIPYLADRIQDSPNSLLYNSPTTVYRGEIALALRKFCDPETYGKPEFWGYYADYDWVAICQLFGTMMDLPKGWPMYCRDINQLWDDVGNPTLPTQGKDEHHALADARWNKLAWEYLRDYWGGDTVELYSKCDPTRQPGGPRKGDTSWLFTVPLVGGRILHLRMGEEGRQTLRGLVLWEEIDTAADEALVAPQGETHGHEAP